MFFFWRRLIEKHYALIKIKTDFIVTKHKLLKYMYLVINKTE